MADFKIALKRTAIFEGGYVNDPDDAGGETYKGISRKANPKWEGWIIVDAMRYHSNFPKILDTNQKLQELAEKCYKENYWNPIWGDKIIKQEVANDMYDTGVNMGVATSVKLSERQFKLPETGRMSEALLSKLNSVV